MVKETNVNAVAQPMVSVCLASYNGEKYIREQIESILSELSQNDEIIICDDASSDTSFSIIQSISDPRITPIRNTKNIGHVKTFEKAMSLAKGDLIFLSDQDDIWVDGRVSLMVRKIINTGASLVSSNFDVIDKDGTLMQQYLVGELKSKDSSKHFMNIIKIIMGKASYFGCAMAFRRNMINLILPIPSFVECHDLWIALTGNLICSNVHLEEITLKRRLHDNNVTNPNRKLFEKIRGKIIIVISIMYIVLRIIRIKIERYLNNPN